MVFFQAANLRRTTHLLRASAAGRTRPAKQHQIIQKSYPASKTDVSLCDHRTSCERQEGKGQTPDDVVHTRSASHRRQPKYSAPTQLSSARICSANGLSDAIVQCHKNGLLGSDSGVSKWPICLASNANCLGKNATAYGHMRQIYDVQTDRLLIARTIDHSLQNELANDCSVRPS